MHPLHHGSRPSSARAAVSVLLGIGLLLFGTGEASASTPTPFVSLQQPISVAAMSGRLLATRFCADRVLSVSRTGRITKFADLPGTGNACLARDVVVSPGLGGFQRSFVYAVQKQTIYEIPPTGGSATEFVTIASLQDSESSLTFDRVGTFGFELIVTGRLGEVWRVTSGGVATKVTDVGHHIEGPWVVPSSFAPFGGQILATNDFTDSVFAVAADGTETPVVTYDSPESVVGVPRTICEFGSTGGGFFIASQTNDTIFKLPKNDFTGLTQQHALVLTKGGTIGLLTSQGGNVTVSDFEPSPFAQELESGTFFPCR